MSLLGATTAIALHATPLFVFPIFPAGPFGSFGISVLHKSKAGADESFLPPLQWRVGLGAGQELNDALNLGADVEYILGQGIGISAGMSFHGLKNYQHYYSSYAWTEGGVIENPERAKWAVGWNVHLALRWESAEPAQNTQGTGLLGTTPVRFFADWGFSHEFLVWKRDSEFISRNNAALFSSAGNRLPSRTTDLVFMTAGLLL